MFLGKLHKQQKHQDTKVDLIKAPNKTSVQMKLNNTVLSQIISNKAWNILFTW